MQDLGGPEGSVEYRAEDQYRQADTILSDGPSAGPAPAGYPDSPPMNTGYGPGNYPPPPTDHYGQSPGAYGYAQDQAAQSQPMPGPQVQAQPMPGQPMPGQPPFAAPAYPAAQDGDSRRFDPAMGGESGRIVVDMHTPVSNADAIVPAGPGSAPANAPAAGGFAPPPQPIPVADPHAGAAPTASDPATARLHEWLGRRGIGPAYFSSYVRARNIIWGGDPGGPVDPGDIERALEARATRATPQQLENLRDLGTLLTQYYGVPEDGVAPVAQPRSRAPQPQAPQPQAPQPQAQQPPANVPLSRRAAPIPVDPQPDQVLTADDLFDEPDEPAPGRRESQHPTTDIPVVVDVEPHQTPVPMLLEESAVDMQLDRPAIEVDNESTGATPLVQLGSDQAKPETFPDSPTWSLPQGFASAWDPRTRDQRPNEVLRPPRPAVVTFGVPAILLVAIAVALYFALGG